MSRVALAFGANVIGTLSMLNLMRRTAPQADRADLLFLNVGQFMAH